MIAFISTLTETTTHVQLLSEILIDVSFYTVLSGIVGWMLFGKEKKKLLTKALFTLMILAPGLYLVLKFSSN